MPINLILSAVLGKAETLLNKALTLDPTSNKKLTRLSGTTIVIKSVNPECSLFISVHEQGFSLSPVITDITEKTDAEISGPSQELIKLLFAKEKGDVIRNKDIQLKGDITSIQELQNIFLELDIDWEYQLSKFIGDVPTQTLSDGIELLKSFVNQSTLSLKTNIDEYIHEEAKLLPSSNELENFYQRIDALRLRLDRSQARINNFESKQ